MTVDTSALVGTGSKVLGAVAVGRQDMARVLLETLSDEALSALGVAADVVVMMTEAEVKRRNPDEAPPATEKTPMGWPKDDA